MRRVGVALGRRPAPVAILVQGRVPAVRRHVDPADEGQGIVDHDELLVMRPSRRMVRIPAVAKAVGGQPVPDVHGQHRVRGRDRKRHVPVKDLDREGGVALERRQQRVLDRLAALALREARAQADAGIEVPAEDPDGMARVPDGLVERGEVVLGVDQQGDATRLLDPPAGLPGLEERTSFVPRAGSVIMLAEAGRPRHSGRSSLWASLPTRRPRSRCSAHGTAHGTASPDGALQPGRPGGSP
jgi:hypothetical protein